MSDIDAQSRTPICHLFSVITLIFPQIWRTKVADFLLRLPESQLFFADPCFYWLILSNSIFVSIFLIKSAS